MGWNTSFSLFKNLLFWIQKLYDSALHSYVSLQKKVTQHLTSLFVTSYFLRLRLQGKPSTDCYFLLLLFVLRFQQNCPQSCQVLSNPVKFCKIMSNPIKLCQILSNFVKSFQMLLNPVKICQILSNFVKSYSFQNFIKSCLILSNPV